MRQDIPTIAQARQAAAGSLSALKYGTVTVTSIDVDEEVKPGTRFTLRTDDGAPLAEGRLARLKGRLEAHSFRLLRTSQDDGSVVVDAFHSIRTIGMVDRHAQRGSRTLIVLHGSHRLFEIDAEDVDDLDRLLLTRKDDEVVLWEDVLGDWTPKINAFVNRSMRELV